MDFRSLEGGDRTLPVQPPVLLFETTGISKGNKQKLSK